MSATQTPASEIWDVIVVGAGSRASTTSTAA